MSFEVELIGGFNPFEWEEFICPVCHKNHFVSHSHGTVYCDYCGARFSVRMTAGDPGCVVDCYVHSESIYAPSYTCSECQLKIGLFDFEEIKCPHCDTRELSRDERLMRVWNGAKDLPTAYCLILKTGDYCSGWMPDNIKDHDRLDFPTQKQWEDYQDTILSTSGLGVNIHARCVEIVE